MGNNICKTSDEKEEEIVIEPYVQQQKLEIHQSYEPKTAYIKPNVNEHKVLEGQ